MHSLWVLESCRGGTTPGVSFPGRASLNTPRGQEEQVRESRESVTVHCAHCYLVLWRRGGRIRGMRREEKRVAREEKVEVKIYESMQREERRDKRTIQDTETRLAQQLEEVRKGIHRLLSTSETCHGCQRGCQGGCQGGC